MWSEQPSTHGMKQSRVDHAMLDSPTGYGVPKSPALITRLAIRDRVRRATLKGMMMRRFIHGSQAPADCEVFGQDETGLTWRDGLIASAVVMALLGLGWFWALLDGAK